MFNKIWQLYRAWSWLRPAPVVVDCPACEPFIPGWLLCRAAGDFPAGGPTWSFRYLAGGMVSR